MDANPSQRLALLALASLTLWAGIARAQGLELLGQPIAPGDQRRLPLPVSETFVGEEASTPVIVVADALPHHLHPGDALALDVHVVSDLRVPLEGGIVTGRLD